MTPIISSDRTYSQMASISEATSLSPMAQVTGAMLVRETPTPTMELQVNLPGLLKQLGQLAINSSETDVALCDVARLLGNTFQVDGCLVTFTPPIQAEIRTVGWLSESDQVMRSSTRITPQEQMSATSDRSSTVIPDVQALPEISEARLRMEELVDAWEAISTSTDKFPFRALLDVSTQLPEARLRISLLRSRPYSWPASQVEQLEVVAQHVAGLLSHLNLKQQLKRQSEYQRVVKELATATRNSSNLDGMFELATSSVATALGVSHAMLLRLRYCDPLIRNRTGEQIPAAKVTVMYEWLKAGSNPPASAPVDSASVTTSIFSMVDCTLCQQAFLHAPKATAINSVQQLFEGPIPATPLFPLGEMDSLLIAPLESQGNVLGFLVLRDQHSHSWQPEDTELVELVSAQISTAIMQTETLRQVQSLVDKRTAELKQSLMVQAKLYERTRIQLEQLRKLNQLKDEFLDTVSHELRTPLTSMALAIRMLRQTGTESDRGARYLDILEQQCAQETNLINDLLALRDLDSNQTTLQLEELDLVELIQSVTTSFQSKWVAQGLTLVLNGCSASLHLWSDRESLTRILVELFTNATRYADPHTCLCLTLADGQEDSGNEIVLKLCNQGAAIPPEELPYIFDRFRRCQSAIQNAVPGTGLGLALVKSLTQHLNGTIAASSVPMEQSQAWETCFTLTLPRTPGNSI